MSVPLTVPDAGAWSSSDPYTAALQSGGGPLFLACADGLLIPLDVERWCAAPDAADRTVLAACDSPVLDIGCGPGRIVTELAARGQAALGVDVHPHAVRRTQRAGGSALVRSVFDALPREGRWRTALLMDGNIGIGGDPHALLGRVRRLLRPGGTLIAETATGRRDQDERLQVRLHDGTESFGAQFPWALVSSKALARYAASGGWSRVASWTVDGRTFTTLRAPHP